MFEESTNPLQRLAHEHDHTQEPRTPPRMYKQAFEEADSWKERANCLGQTHDMFPRWHKDISYISKARAICRACPVQPECLEEALQYPVTDMHGVWAGLTPRQLAAEQQRRGIKSTKPTLAQIWADFARLERKKRDG